MSSNAPPRAWHQPLNAVQSTTRPPFLYPFPASLDALSPYLLQCVVAAATWLHHDVLQPGQLPPQPGGLHAQLGQGSLSHPIHVLPIFPG